MCAGGATTTVYPSTQHEDVAFILSDSDSKVVFAEDETQVAKIIDHLPDLPLAGQDRAVRGQGRLTRRSSAGATSSSSAATICRPIRTAVDEAIAATGPEHLATLIYTSGTTGRPKGVRLMHDSWTYLGVAVEEYDIICSRRPAVPLAAAQPRVRQGPSSRSSCGSASPPRWTAGSTRSSTTSGSSSPPSWPARRGSSRRSGPR